MTWSAVVDMLQRYGYAAEAAAMADRHTVHVTRETAEDWYRFRGGKTICGRRISSTYNRPLVLAAAYGADLKDYVEAEMSAPWMQCMIVCPTCMGGVTNDAC